MKQPKKLIKDVTFDFEKEETKCGPHIAYTLDIQGGAASGHNKSFLFKADEVSEEVLKAIQELGITDLEEVNKDFGLAGNKRSLLEQAVKKQFADEDTWCWVVDFNDTTIYFSTYKGVYAVGYEYDVASGDVKLDKLAEKAIQLNMFTIQSGKMKLSEQAEDDIEQGLLVIMEKALEAGENFKDIEILKSLVESSSQEDVSKSSEEKDSGPVLESDVNVEHPDTGINKNKEDKMELNIQELLKSKEFTDFLEAREAEIQKAADERIKAAETKAEEIEKAAKAEKLARLEKGFTKTVETLSFIKEEDRAEVVKGLVESHDVSVVIKMLGLLEAAQEEITKTKEAFATTEHGEDGEVTVEDTDASMDALLKSLEAKFDGKDYL